MRKVLSEHSEIFFIFCSKMYIPAKFHCEINPIEKCWSEAKLYTHVNTNYTIAHLQHIKPDGLNSVSLENNYMELF